MTLPPTQARHIQRICICRGHQQAWSSHHQSLKIHRLQRHNTRRQKHTEHCNRYTTTMLLLANSRPTCLPTIALPTESQCQGVRENYSDLHTDKPQATGPANICRLHDDASTKGRKCHLRPIKEHFNQGFLLAWTSRRGGNTTSPNASQDGAYRNFAVACFSQSAITW